jgi:hypothetical protein
LRQTEHAQFDQYIKKWVTILPTQLPWLMPLAK